MNKPALPSCVLCLVLAGVFGSAHGYELYDMHLHYNQNTWKRLPPQQAIGLLLENNIRRAGFIFFHACDGLEQGFCNKIYQLRSP